VIVPDSPVPLVGFRIWGVVQSPSGPRLQSASSGFSGGTTLWTPYQAFGASCLAARDCGAAPNPAHNCGVHSFRTLDDALRWAGDIARVRPVVIGTVRLWGKVVESVRGWRAELAYPNRLLSGPQIEPLAAAYGVACDG